MKRRTITGLLAALALLMIMPVAYEPGEGAYIERFQGSIGGGLVSDLIKLKGEGQTVFDSHMFFEIDRNVPIASASFKVGTEGTDESPWVKDLLLDIGGNGDTEWGYTGDGYGDLGHVYGFSDDDTMKTANFNNGGSITLGEFIVPQGSDVTEASIDMRGRFVPTIPSPTTVSSGGSVPYAMQVVRIGDLDGDKLNDTVLSSGNPGYMYVYIHQDDDSFKSTSLTSVGQVYDYVLFDADDDNDLDIVFSQSNGVKYIANNGTGYFSGVTTITSSFVPYRLATGDMDRDGDDDIIGVVNYMNFGSTTNAVRMLKRTSGSSFDLWPVYDTGSGSGSGYSRFLFVDDWNNDGYDDVYLSLSNYRVYTIENPAYEWYYRDTSNISTKSRWTLRTVIVSSYNIVQIDVGDADGDGDADVCMAPDSSWSGVIYYYENKGTSAWSRYNVNSGYMYYPSGVAFADLDSDGYLDILYTAGYSDYYYYNKVSWLDSGGNPSKNSWSETVLMNQQPSTASNCYAGDLNSDGHWDAGFALKTNKQIITYYSVSPYTGKLSAGYIEDGGMAGHRDVEKVDVDLDGDLDLMITAYRSGTVGWLENDGTPWTDEWELHKINKGMVIGANEVMGRDIDGDGDVDCAVTSYDQGKVYWFRNPGDPESLWDTYEVGSLNQPVGVGISDFDKDGKMEIVASSGYYWNDGIQMFYADDPTGSWSKHTIVTGSYCGAIQIVDMNDDGYEDILTVVGGWSGSANIYRNPCRAGTKTSAWPTITTIGGLQYPYEARAFDINNDGTLDVVSTSNYGRNVVWGRGPKNKNSTSGWNAFTISSGRITYPWGIDVCDIDNDGFADIFVTTKYYYDYYYYTYTGVHWLEEGDDPTQAFEYRTIDNTRKDCWAIKAMDGDNDGVEEIYTGSYRDNIVIASRPSLKFPSNVRIDIGSDGVYDFTYGSTLHGMLPGGADLGIRLQSVIDSPPPQVTKFKDGYGNPMLRVPFTLASGTGGKLTVSNMDFRYNVSFFLENNGVIRDAIYRSIPHYDDPSNPTTRVYLIFKGQLSGPGEVRLLVSDLKVEYNAPPKLIGALPTKLTVNEEGISTNVLDLSRYFSDDYDPVHLLHYEAMTLGPNRDKVNVFVTNGANVTIDSTLVEDFDGELSVRFKVTDNGGPGGVGARSTMTKEILVDVLSVPDRPELGSETLPERIYGSEGEEVMSLDLEGMDLFTDADDSSGTSINHMLLLDPDDSYPEDISGVRAVLRGKKVYVSSEGDFNGRNIPLALYGFNGAEPNYRDDPRHMTYVDINNTNDGPWWSEIPSVEVLEDTSRSGFIDLSKYVNDIDSPMSSLSYQLLSYTSSTYVYIKQQSGDPSRLDYEPRYPDWYGTSILGVQVSDGEYSSTTTFSVEVMSVNDPPSLEIRYPLEMTNYEEGRDLSIAGTAYDVEGISVVEIFFDGGLEKADLTRIEGRALWGMTFRAPDVDERTDYELEVRALDTDGELVTAYVNVTVSPRVVLPPSDSDGDGVDDIFDDFPDDPSEYRDSDLDGVGDRTDFDPKNPLLTKDSDKDGLADEVDPYPFIPGEPRDGIEGPEEGSTRSFPLVPVLLWLVAVVMLVLAVLSVLAYVGKRRASRDPKLAVSYVRKQESRRDRARKLLGVAHLDRLLTRMQLGDVDVGSKPGPRMPYMGPGAVPMRGPSVQPMMHPARVTPALPPHPHQPSRGVPMPQPVRPMVPHPSGPMPLHRPPQQR